MNKIPLTVRGAEKLRDELHQLKTVERPKVIDDISEARAHGDLKENAEYHAAREQQGFVEGRIQDLESKLSNAQEIDVTTIPQNGKVVFGVTVDLEDEKSGEAVTYQIVGDDESDIKKGKISVNSPIARAMIGREEGDVAVVQAPGGVRNLEIVEIRYTP
ncbi:MAG: transcription elongation factor GreA [Gammaproteobacteria bacterium]|jgi:transcription elongation factor GreA|nr:transcription elongation factor GreA [Gammaproteobacteria bacterium]MBT7308013.1 transcription elongation factor GreA [Gammaproteobacteria bacterium]